HAGRLHVERPDVSPRKLEPTPGVVKQDDPPNVDPRRRGALQNRRRNRPSPDDVSSTASVTRGGQGIPHPMNAGKSIPAPPQAAPGRTEVALPKPADAIGPDAPPFSPPPPSSDDIAAGADGSPPPAEGYGRRSARGGMITSVVFLATSTLNFGTQI